MVNKSRMCETYCAQYKCEQNYVYFLLNLIFFQYTIYIFRNYACRQLFRSDIQYSLVYHKCWCIALLWLLLFCRLLIHGLYKEAYLQNKYLNDYVFLWLYGLW